MQISKIYNANCYIDGTNSLLGRAAEITLPDIAAETDEHKALGMIGSISFPTGLAAMEAKVKWNGFYPEVLTLGANPFTAHKLQLRASVESYEAGGRVAEKPLIVLMTARFKKTPLGTFGAMTSVEFEQELYATYIKATLDGVELVEIDVMENVWRVGGVDILAAYKKNLQG